MRWFTRHIDPLLESWALGELSSAQAARLLRHAHACERCGGLYERWVRAHRVLEHRTLDTPASVELSGLEAAGLEAALSAAAPRPQWLQWPALMAFAGTVAAVCLVLVVSRGLAPSGVDEWQARGVQRVEPGAVLRVFCAAPNAGLRELAQENTCPHGAVLAVAVAAEPPLTHVALRLQGSGVEETGGPFVVASRPGQEVPLEWTPRLPDTGDTVEVVAAFASSREAALRAGQGREETERVVRRYSVKLGPQP